LVLPLKWNKKYFAYTTVYIFILPITVASIVCVKLGWDISSFEILMCSDLWPIYDINDKKISNLTPSKFPKSSYAVFGRFSRPHTLTLFNFSQEGNIQMSWNFSCFMTSWVLSEKLWKNFFTKIFYSKNRLLLTK